mmetsp:Transcript_3397/g.8832  ORF Transcript_3397/g.8832 Transcript_3397/m.8832 type:complete len:129 (+) Transcript_3397:75-461(+)
MSWQAYVDDHLVGSGTVSQAAIIGVGAYDTWATSPGFTVSTEEAKALIDGLKNTDSFASNGIILNGQKYMYIKSDGGKEVHGKKGATGCSAFKGNTFVIVCVHDDTIQPGQCSATGGKLADYLIEQGM